MIQSSIPTKMTLIRQAAGYILHSEQTDHHAHHLVQADYEQLPNKLGYPLLNRYVI